tara:strand:- start:29 stop:799 length:771 start_codon:yes stop_codon:yes gene_type:complete
VSIQKGHGLNDFLAKVAKGGGMSFSNNFLVEFQGISKKYFDAKCVEFFCDEAQLPNMNTATGSQVGLYTGLGAVDYPHTRVFTEFSLTFMLDANLSLLKSLNAWYFDIFGEAQPGMNDNGLAENRVTYLRYKNEYCSDIHISKTEAGLNSSIERRPITYVMEKCFPYQIDAIPLQFGSSSITKVSAQFKYQRHYTKLQNIENSPQLGKGQEDLYFGYQTVPKPEAEETKWPPEEYKRSVSTEPKYPDEYPQPVKGW